MINSKELEVWQPLVLRCLIIVICFDFFKVPVRSLPYLPDCPVANLANSTFVGNVECVCSDVKCQSQIRIKPIAGTGITRLSVTSLLKLPWSKGLFESGGIYY